MGVKRTLKPAPQLHEVPGSLRQSPLFVRHPHRVAYQGRVRLGRQLRRRKAVRREQFRVKPRQDAAGGLRWPRACAIAAGHWLPARPLIPLKKSGSLTGLNSQVEEEPTTTPLRCEEPEKESAPGL